MADILISKFTTQIPRVGATPATPGFAESEGQDPVAPSGSPLVYTPVTIGSPENGLSIDASQVLSLGLASASATGALSSTDWNTFNNKLNLTSLITGYTVGANTALAATDTILQAFGKVQGQINARISGTIASGQVAFGTGVNTVGGNNNLAWDNANARLTITGNQTLTGHIRGTTFTDLNTAQSSQSTIRVLSAGFTPANRPSGNFFVGLEFTSLETNNGYKGQLGVGSTGNESNLFYRSADLNGVWSAWRNVLIAAANTAGQMPFGTGGSIVSWTSNIFWDNTNSRFGVLTTSPTNTLDVNGTARIRTISNLGTAATSVLVPSATGVLSLRTLAELASDMSSVLFTAQTLTASQKNQARVNIGSTSATPQVIATAGAINDLAVTSNHLVFTGASVVLSGIVAGLDGEEITILNASGTNLELLSQSALSVASNRFASGVIVPNLSIVRIKYRTTTARWVLENVGINDGRYVRKDISDTKTGDLTFQNNSSLLWNTGAGIGNNVFRFNSFLDAAFQLQQNGTTYLRTAFASILWNRTISIYSGDIASAIPGGTLNATLNPSGRFFHQRSGASNESIRRDELYLNYSQTVATAGTINDLAINADCKLLILTAATDLTGVVPVDNTRLLRIEARTASRIIRHESASSTAANRFSIGADLTINAGEVYQFIYTDSRWRFINDTRDQFAVKTTATADQTLPSGVLTILDYDSTLLNNSTNTYTVGTDGRITINRTGIYTITAGVVIEADAVTALESAFLGIFRNGDLVAISSINTTIAAGTQSGLSTSTILSLTATDIIDCRALVNSVGGVANGLARRLGTLLGANATQVNSLSITKNSM